MDISRIKENARRSLSGNWGLAIIASIIASIFGSGSGSISFNFDTSDFEGFENAELDAILGELGVFIEENIGIILAFLGGFAVIGFITSIVIFCLGSIINVGYQRFNIDLLSTNRASIGSLFSYFKHWKSAILSNVLVTVYVFLWSLLCVVPGIIASFKYAMVPYIIADDPTISANEALESSERMMYGHKMELFRLGLSFIGWHLLAILSCGIGYIWLTPYINASGAEFYRTVSGKKYYTATANPTTVEIQ